MKDNAETVRRQITGMEEIFAKHNFDERILSKEKSNLKQFKLKHNTEF